MLAFFVRINSAQACFPAGVMKCARIGIKSRVNPFATWANFPHLFRVEKDRNFFVVKFKAIRAEHNQKKRFALLGMYPLLILITGAAGAASRLAP